MLTLLTGCLETVSQEGLMCDTAHPCGEGLVCWSEHCRRPIPTMGAGCETSSDCTKGVCDVENRICVTCLEDSDCKDGVCLTDGQVCVQCRASADCATGRCDTVNNTCLSCRSDVQCESGECDEDTGICAPPGSASGPMLMTRTEQER